MATVNLTINGQKLTGESGTTVLDVAERVGIDIPTLCDHPLLEPIGACRMCLVEIKGQRNLQPSCTFPITEGMEVQTESPAVVEARKFTLDLLFSERNHYCMYCEMSGDCELQNLGYRYGLDHWVYPTYTKRFPVDASRDYFLMDHNRCILCRRCVRACSELVANHTLGLRNRGASTMISPDMNVRFGDSSCVSCGTCLSVCPTGALVDKRSAFMGRNVQVEHVKSICNQCGLGCGVDIITRGGNVLRTEGDWDSPVNHGVLCKLGRFAPLFDERERITQPMVRSKGKLHEATWDDALKATGKHLKDAPTAELGVLASSNTTNEALFLVNRLFCDGLKATNIGLMNDVAPALGKLSPLSEIKGADLFIVAGCDPAVDQPVASFLVKKEADNGARIVVVGSKKNGLAPFAHLTLAAKDVSQAVDLAKRATKPVVVYGAGITSSVATALKGLGPKASFVVLQPGVNTVAANALGLANGFKAKGAKTLFVVAGEERGDGRWLGEIDSDAFVIAVASFKSPLTERADVVLPMAIWSERSGTLTNTEGLVQKANGATKARGQAKPDWEILSLVGSGLGKKVAPTLDALSASVAEKLK